MIEFLYPDLWILIFAPLIVRWFLPPVKGLFGDALKVPFVEDIKKFESQKSKNNFFSANKSAYGLGFWLLLTTWIFLTVAAMRPVLIGSPVRVENKGRDILMVLDISTSMLEQDFSFSGKRLDRLTAVKAVVADFIERRNSDKIGLILFGTRAYLQAPLTFDRQSVKEILWTMDAGMAGNSTAIGDALGLALKSFDREDTDSENKVIILLTDGENNDGTLSLPQAVDLARKEGVKIYTIGVGGGYNSFVGAFFGLNNTSLDEKSLKELAAETKGRYFRADDLAALDNVYRQIDQLEPQNQQQNFIYPRREIFYWALLGAILTAFILIFKIRSVAA